MVRRVHFKDQKLGHVTLALALGVLFLSHPVRGETLLDVWRSAFAPDTGATSEPDQTLKLQTALGEKLFRDTRLSGDRARACLSCHQPELGFTDGLAQARALSGVKVTLRNTPTLYNLASAQVFNWDGSAASLEQQVLGPIQNRAELAGTFSVILARLRKDKSMVEAFAKAFPVVPKITQDAITKALASYVRSLRSPETNFDAWVRGEDTALNAQQRAGFQLFVGKGGCVACHSGPRFTDEAFHDIGLPDRQKFNDKEVAAKKGVRAFKTPTLRAISKTEPYMHNGSLQTLSDVVNHYTDGLVRRRGLSGILPPKLVLSRREKAALVAFLETL